MIYASDQKLDTNWHVALKWLLVDERRKPQMEGVRTNSIYFYYIIYQGTHYLFAPSFFIRDTKSLPQLHISSSLEKENASYPYFMISHDIFLYI